MPPHKTKRGLYGIDLMVHFGTHDGFRWPRGRIVEGIRKKLPR
jgi:hypothetical protein